MKSKLEIYDLNSQQRKVRNNQFDIYTIPAEGGEETQLTNTPRLDDGRGSITLLMFIRGRPTVSSLPSFHTKYNLA